MHFDDKKFLFRCEAAKGSYKGAAKKRSYQLVVHGLTSPVSIILNGKRIASPETPIRLPILPGLIGMRIERY
jgi:hypothetical protein